MYQHIRVPTQGQKITVNRDFTLNVPDNPIIPFIEGDGTGVVSGPLMETTNSFEAVSVSSGSQTFSP